MERKIDNLEAGGSNPPLRTRWRVRETGNPPASSGSGRLVVRFHPSPPTMRERIPNMNRLVDEPSPEDDGAKERVRRARQELYDAECAYDEHVVVRKTVPDFSDGDFVLWGGARCHICSRSLGWYCPESPDGVCHYEPGNKGCVHCGQPMERK